MVFLLLFVIPLGAALVVEYGFCRFPKRRLWRWLPPLLTGLGTVLVTLFRYHGWSAGTEKAPWETLLFIPGLPALGETVCNYDEGFLAGILTAYTQKPYTAVEVDCWATGDRVCRFRAEIQQTGKGK